MKVDTLNILQNITVCVNCGETQGTAFFISPQTLLTCFHVIKDNIQSNSNIILRTYRGKYIESELHECMRSQNNQYKAKDIAILTVKDEFRCTTTPQVSFINVSTGNKWISRGFNSFKEQGENLIGENNIIQQIHESPINQKYNIELNIEHKYKSYEGFSGAPLVVDNNIVGIINSELRQSGTTCELYALSLKEIKDIWQILNIKTESINEYDVNIDTVGANSYKNLKKEDIRDLKTKILNVCNNYNIYKIQKFQRDAFNGLCETERFDPKQIASMKFRIFEACQDYLIDFLEQTKKNDLTPQEINDVIENFVNKAREVIDDKSKDYLYPLRSTDILKKIVYDLIDSCYLSFDEKGIYHE